MSDESHSSDSADGKPKIFNLDALLPAKGSITTSIGTIYTRHPYIGDWNYFELENADELALAAIQRLCNRIEDKQDSSPLDDVDLKLLTDTDIQALVQAIAKQSGWRELPSGSGLKDLGELIKEEKQVMTEKHERMLGDLRKSINTSYSFLGKGALEKLQEQMSGIANIRSSLERAESLHKAYELPKFIAPPRFEETPMGRATFESLENSRQLAKKMDDLVVIVAGLNQTLVQDVLPAWAKKFEEDQNAAKIAFKQAAIGLWWTKWAVIVSVFVTIASTWWQVDVAKKIDRENSEQQKRSEGILREQLAEQQKLIEQQAKDAAAIREVVGILKQQMLIEKPK